MTGQHRQTPRWPWILIKLAVAAAVVAWMVHKDLIRPEELLNARSHWPLLLVAFAAIMLDIFLTAVRWDLLLRPQAIRIRLAELYRLTMVGFFFTVVAPGGLGGDAVKAFLVARGRQKNTEAVTTVFLDRFIGLASLFMVALLMAALNFNRLWNASIHNLDRFGMPGGRLLVLAIAACSVGVILFSLLAMSKRVRQLRLLQSMTRHLPFRPTLAKVYEAVHLYGNHPGPLFGALAVSLAAQVPLYLTYYIYAVAVGADIHLWHCALIVPPAMVIRVLPLVPGGAGQGMVAMGLLFPLVGIPAAKGAAIGALGDAMFILTFLIGGVFFVFSRAEYREARAAVAAKEEPHQP